MVEKSGQMGLQMRRDTSGEPRSSTRRTSFSNDEERRPGMGRSDSSASEYTRKKSGAVVEDSIPEMETPNTATDEKVAMAPKEVPKVEAKKAVEVINGSEGMKSNGNSNGTPKSKVAAEKAPLSKTNTRPTPISTAKAAVAPKTSPVKSPAVPKTPTTPRGRGRTTEQSGKMSEKKPQKKASRSSLAPAHTRKPASRPSSTAASHVSPPKTRIHASPPQTGFVKPKPRSPTRPVKLPASLMAHTASSGSKTATSAPPPRRSLSRATGKSPSTNSLQAHSGVVRSPSRTSTTSTSKTSTLTRKASTLNKTSTSGRPSLGPPPATLKKQSSRQSLSKSAPADDSFLNRMMRPTTSSASKTAATGPSTPPKRATSVKRPATRETNHRTHEAPKGSPRVPNPAVKAAAAVTKPVAKPIAKVATSVSKHGKKEPENKADPVVGNVKIVEKTPKEASETVEKPLKAEDSKETGVSESAKTAEAAEPVVVDDSIEAPSLEDLKEEESTPEEIDVSVQETAEEDTLTTPAPALDEPEVAEEPEINPEPFHQVLSPVVESPIQARNPVIAEQSPSIKADQTVAPDNTTPEAITKETPEPSMTSEAASLENKKNVEADEPKAEEAVTSPPMISEVKPAEQHDVEVAEAEVSEPAPLKEDEAKIAQPEKIEDPEDVRAREEIARLNAELMRSVDETY